MTDMVEKVAKAIWDSRTRGADFRRYNYDWEHVAAEIRKNNMEYARAAIRALMEPTEEMYGAALNAYPPDHTREVWQAMLKAALDD